MTGTRTGRRRGGGVMNFFWQLLDRLPRSTQQKLERRAAQMVVWMSAARGSVSLWGKEPPRILIDNCVLRNGLTHTNAWISTGVSMWGGQVPVETGYSARVPVDYALHNRSIYEVEVPYFAPLAKMAKTGRLRLFTSAELLAERNRHSSYDPYWFGMNLWSGVPIETLPDMPRSTEMGYCLHPAGLREAWSKEGQIAG